MIYLIHVQSYKIWVPNLKICYIAIIDAFLINSGIISWHFYLLLETLKKSRIYFSRYLLSNPHLKNDKREMMIFWVAKQVASPYWLIMNKQGEWLREKFYDLSTNRLINLEYTLIGLLGRMSQQRKVLMVRRFAPIFSWLGGFNVHKLHRLTFHTTLWDFIILMVT